MNGYVVGMLKISEAHAVLERLGYKGEALRIELKLWADWKEQYRRRVGLP